jgi:WD40 repeat protein
MISELGQDSAGHEDWVRDVAWCNNIGSTQDMIASCDENKRLKIWRNSKNNQWELIFEQAF